MNQKLTGRIAKGWEGAAKVVSISPFWTILKDTEVLETNLYDRFILDIKNRPISEEKVAFFIKSFKQGKFFMKEFPVIVDSKLIILDGQHRFEAVKRLSIPLLFRFAENLNIENVVDVQLNAGWKTEDYLHAFIQQGNQNYVILSRFINRYKISITVAVSLLTNTSNIGMTRSGFYEGSFVVKDEPKAHEQAKAINKLGEMALGLNRDRTFCLAVVKLMNHPEYEEKRMIDQITKYVSLMKRQMKVDDYLINLEEIYNYKLYMKNKVRFI